MTTENNEAALPRNLFGLLSDVDGTLTQGGQLLASTYQALWSLHQSGLKIIPVTGRSAAWGHMLLHHWPVDAVVAESGGVALWREQAGGQIVLAHEAGLQRFGIVTRCFGDHEGRKPLIAQLEALLPRYAPLSWASDQGQRIVDVAIDWNEQQRGNRAIVARLSDALRALGFQARTSNVHLNAWAGSFDKASSSFALIEQVFGQRRDEAQAGWFFVGDAPNDESMFASFPHHLAVEGPEHFEGQVQHMPQRFSTSKAAAGFEALAQSILRAMRSP